MKSGDRDWLHTEPMLSLVEGIARLANKVYQHTGKHALKQVALDRHLALNIGITSKKPATINTPAGPVQLVADGPIYTKCAQCDDKGSEMRPGAPRFIGGYGPPYPVACSLCKGVGGFEL